LLAVLDIQPPPDFAVQVLARVYALQAARVSAPVPYARAHAESPPSRSIRRASWPGWPRSRLLGLSLVTSGLLVTSAVLLWCVSIRTLPVEVPAGAWSTSMTVQDNAVSGEDARDGAGRHTTSPQEVVAAVEPGRQSILLAPQRSETHMSEEDLARQGASTTLPETPVASTLPVWSRGAPQLSAHAQRPGRQRGIRGKAKRSVKSLRLSRYVPA
jgi:hypothetical protein